MKIIDLYIFLSILLSVISPIVLTIFLLTKNQNLDFLIPCSMFLTVILIIWYINSYDFII